MKTVKFNAVKHGERIGTLGNAAFISSKRVFVAITACEKNDGEFDFQTRSRAPKRAHPQR